MYRAGAHLIINYLCNLRNLRFLVYHPYRFFASAMKALLVTDRSCNRAICTSKLWPIHSSKCSPVLR